MRERVGLDRDDSVLLLAAKCIRSTSNGEYQGKMVERSVDMALCKLTIVWFRIKDTWSWWSGKGHGVQKVGYSVGHLYELIWAWTKDFRWVFGPRVKMAWNGFSNGGWENWTWEDGIRYHIVRGGHGTSLRFIWEFSKYF